MYFVVRCIKKKELIIIGIPNVCSDLFDYKTLGQLEVSWTVSIVFLNHIDTAFIPWNCPFFLEMWIWVISGLPWMKFEKKIRLYLVATCRNVTFF